MIDRKQILWGITNDDDRLFLSKMCDAAERSINSGKVMFSRFLNPGQRMLLESRMSGQICLCFFGGCGDAERTVAAIGSGEVRNEDYPISALRVCTKNKKPLSHRDYLGSLLSLGIKRELVGDIVIKDEYALVFCTKEISDFITDNLKRVASQTVNVSPEEDLTSFHYERQYKEISVTVSSLRFDCVLSAVTGKSRSASADLIEQGFAFINYDTVKSISACVKNGDVLSVRGFGKMIIETDNSLTKKGRIHIKVKKYI